MDNLPTTTRQPSLIASLAGKYNMDPKNFELTVRKTVMPSNATNEEFAAFLMVAHEYKLNPILKEIHAFPKKGGGIQPVISIDGWVSLINQHPMMDGVAFEEHHDAKGELYACTCTIRRKDRSHPITVTEYLAECYRATEPWKMKHRMLRHKALIQAARYAFGFAGLPDEDEAAPLMDMRDVTPMPAPKAPPAPPAATKATASKAPSPPPAPTHDTTTGEIVDAEPSAADIYQLGAEAFGRGDERSVPGELMQLGKADAWLEGYDTAAEQQGGK